MNRLKLLVRMLMLALAFMSIATLLEAQSPSGKAVQERVDLDVRAGRPIVVHVVVALCDNLNQGIVPVTKALGDGQNPRTNLYWGAAYGVRTYFKRQPQYELVQASLDRASDVLDTAVFHAQLERNGAKVDVYVVAEAWDGSKMPDAIARFLRLAAGHEPTAVNVAGLSSPIEAGGGSALVAFVGHNGLMEMPAPVQVKPRPGANARSSVVLACASKPFFRDLLVKGGAHPLLLTTGLMAPEAYSLEAVVSAFATGKTPGQTREAAALAYHRYQKCGRNAALRLFWSEP